MKTIRVGICGYGNLGMGAEKALFNPANDDMKLVAIFTRRDPQTIASASGVDVVSYERIQDYKDKIDVILLCGGSSDDILKQGPEVARWFCTVDSFDLLNKFPGYLKEMDRASRDAGNVSIIAAGWGKGLFSAVGVYMESTLLTGATNVFYGPGINLGQSHIARNIDGVIDAIVYIIPSASAMMRVRTGLPLPGDSKTHQRVCYVVANTDYHMEIEKELKERLGYDTEVRFVNKREFDLKRSTMPHCGSLIRNTNVGENSDYIDFSVKLNSNADYTGSVMVAFARAAYRFNRSGENGAKTVFDVPPRLMSTKSVDDLVKEFL